MERKIGEVFYDCPIKLKVVASTSCDGCHYYSGRCIDGLYSGIRGECSPRGRIDKTSVIFKEVKT